MNRIDNVLTAFAGLSPDQVLALVVIACLGFSAFVIRLIAGRGDRLGRCQ